MVLVLKGKRNDAKQEKGYMLQEIQLEVSSLIVVNIQYNLGTKLTSSCLHNVNKTLKKNSRDPQNLE